MKQCILLFIVLSAHILMGQNLIENPGFENGIASTTINQVDHASGWSNGCRRQFLTVNWCSPDLYDYYGYRDCHVKNILLPRINGETNKRYVHMFNSSTDPTTGESVKGTITETLSEAYSYEVSCYVSREINTVEDDEKPLQLEFVLRNNDNCDLEKIVHTSTYINAVFYNPGGCEGIGTPSTDWRQKLGYFNLDAGDISNGYNRLEIRIKGKSNLLDAIFIDDVVLKKVKKVKACFEIKNIDSEDTNPSKYGPQSIKKLCLPKVEIDGSCSSNENGYHIRISEFDLTTWSFTTDYYEGWVAPGIAPSNINLTDLIGIPSVNNSWTSRTFDPTKLYAVGFSVGAIWDSAPIQFFKVQNCQKDKACFEIKNIVTEHTEPSIYGPQPVKELCLPKVEIDGSCSMNEDGYHIRISEFDLTTWSFTTDYYEGWVAPGIAPSNINLTDLIGIPSVNNSWTSRTFNPTKLYAIGFSIGPVWDSAPIQFFKVKNCHSQEIKACFEIKNIVTEHTESSKYGPKSVKELCLPKVEIDGSCSTNEDGYHIRISEFDLTTWSFTTDYYVGWVAPGTAPSNINLTDLIGVPSANNSWTSRTFDPTKLYAIGFSVGPVWNSAPIQFFKVQNCIDQKEKACFEIKNIVSEGTKPSKYGPQSVKRLCASKVEIDGSCSMNEDGYHIRISEFDLTTWSFTADYYVGWVALGTAPSNINLTDLIGVPSANNSWTSRTFDPTKLYAIGFSVGPVWNSAPIQFFKVQNCIQNYSNTTMSIYPNPTKSYVNFRFNENKSGSISIYRFNGTLIHTKNFREKNNLSFDMRTYKKGLYIAKITIRDETKTFTISKE